MSAGYAEIAITSVLNSEKSFCKFLSANDTGATGAHQSNPDFKNCDGNVVLQRTA